MLSLFAGAENWLWRRVSLLASVVELLRGLEIAAQKGDSATVAQIIIGLIGVLGLYNAASVTDDHFKRKTDAGDDPPA